MEDRRKYERKLFKIPCRFGNDEAPEEGIVANLSMGGICIREASAVPEYGDEITVILHLSPGYDCELKAHVVHTQPDLGCFGVEFVNPLTIEKDDPKLLGMLA
jgi:hypothetical protein